MSTSMSIDREFQQLVGIQLSELAVKIDGPLPPDTPTKIGLNLGISRGKRKDSDVVLVTLELRADAAPPGHVVSPYLQPLADSQACGQREVIRQKFLPQLWNSARKNTRFPFCILSFDSTLVTR